MSRYGRTLADALKSLMQGVSRRLIGEAEHFWQKRYYDFNIRNERQFAEKLRYIHRNPVKGGLWEHPEDWEWSGFLHCDTGREGRIEIESEWTARKRERVAGKTFSESGTAPLKPKDGLNGPPAIALSGIGNTKKEPVAQCFLGILKMREG